MKRTYKSNDVVHKQFVPEAIEKVVKDGMSDRVRRFVISTESPDRDNDTISVMGWKTANYQKNPVVLWAHDYSQLPIARALSVGNENGKLVATAEFADHAFADTVLRLIDGKFLNATSVGFRPMKYVENVDRGGVDFTEQELLEFSIVPVPANAEALVTMSDTPDGQMLRGWAEAVIKGLTKAEETPLAKPVKEESTDATVVVDLPVEETAETIVAEAEEAVAAEAEAAEALAKRVAELGNVAKAGRKLSRANEERLRAAKDQIDEVLLQLEKQPESNGDEAEASDEKEPKQVAPMACEHGAGCETCKAAAPVEELALVFDEGFVLELGEADDALPFSIEDVKAALSAVVTEALGQIARDTAETTVNRLRGRVD